MHRRRFWDVLHEQSTLSGLALIGLMLVMLVVLDTLAMERGFDLTAIFSHSGSTAMTFMGLIGTVSTLYAGVVKIFKPDAPVVVKAPDSAAITDVVVTTQPQEPQP